MSVAEHELTPRAGRTIALAVFSSLLLSGVVLRIGLLSSDNLIGLPAHALTLSLHGALMLVALPLALLMLTPAQQTEAGIRRVICASYVLGGVIMGGAAPLGLQSTALDAAGTTLMLLGLALYAARCLAPSVHTPEGRLVALAALSLVVSWLGPLLGAAGLLAMMLFPLVLVSLLLPLVALRARGERVDGPAVYIAAGSYLLSRMIVRYWSEAAPLALVEWLAAALVAGAALRASAREGTPWRRWLLRLQALLFLEGVSVVALDQIALPESHLHDTLAPTGALHLEAFVVLVALLRAFLPDARGAWPVCGLALMALGAHAFALGCVVLGAAGMPRGYGAYIEHFTTMQVVTSVGALTLLLGLGLIVTARGESSARESSGPSAF